jgi:hypothetical protein
MNAYVMYALGERKLRTIVGKGVTGAAPAWVSIAREK